MGDTKVLVTGATGFIAGHCNPSQAPKHEDELIRPAVDGTLRVLRAASECATVRRVVLTSSTDAIAQGHDPHDHRARTEADWSNTDRSGPYPRSKVYVERAELGWSARPARRSTLDTAESLLQHGFVGSRDG